MTLTKLVCACLGPEDGSISRTSLFAYLCLRFRLAQRSWSRTRRSSDNDTHICHGPHLSRDLGQSDSVSVSERRPSDSRRGRSNTVCAACACCEPALDTPDGVCSNGRRAFALPAVCQRGHAPAGLRCIHPNTVVFADSVAAHRDRTSPPANSAHRQISILADLLAPAIGSRAGKSAQELLQEFGSLAGIAAAPTKAIERVLGGEAALAAMLAAGRAIVHAGMRENVQRRKVDGDDPALLNYLSAQFSGLTDEHLYVLFLDENQCFLGEHQFTSGSPACISCRPRVLFSRALALGAHAILLAHNHPSGDARPSEADIQATHRIRADANGLEITLIDHLIVGRTQIVSMKRAGLL